MEADITADFFNYGASETIANYASDKDAFAFGGLQFDFRSLSRALLTVTATVCFAVLLSHPRSKKVYAVVILVVIVSMIVTPLLQSHQVVAFYQRQEARAGTRGAPTGEPDGARPARIPGRAGR